MSYKKSLLSVAAATVLCTSAIADNSAIYVPLTTHAADNAWVMFGVNDFSNGAPSVLSTGDFTAGYSEVTEADTTDAVASPSAAVIATFAAGTVFEDSGNTKNMATFQALLDSKSAAYFATLSMAIKTNDVLFSVTEPVRSMYISIEGAPSTAKIKLNYKASLEGREFEVQVDGSNTILRGTISQTATFSNPAVAIDKAAAGSADPDLTEVDDVIGYNLTDAPVNPAFYSKTDHQFDATAAAEGAQRFYNYDATTGKWNVWDRAKTGSVANDFTDFEKGKAYWGRFDIDSDGASSAVQRSGVVLGKTANTEADETVYSGQLADGWNMVSFDRANNPDIRNAATGLIVALTAPFAATDAFDITDETGVNKVRVTFAAAHVASDQLIAQHINGTIEAAKILGTVPKSFNVKAFSTDTANELVFISDKKFGLIDAVGANLAGTFFTLGNNNPFTVANGDAATAPVSVNNTNGIQSVYGEFAMITEPLIGAGTAAQLEFDIEAITAADADGAGSSAQVQFGNIDGDSLNTGIAPAPIKLNDGLGGTTIAQLAATVTALDTDDVFDATGSTSSTAKSKGLVTEIDTDFDGTADMVVMAADKPFYIKDNTYTRVYKVDLGTTTGANAATVTSFDVVNTTSATITPSKTSALIASVVKDINDLADDGVGTDDTLTYAAADGTDKLVLVSTDSRIHDLQDTDSTTLDYFTKSTSTATIAKGAVGRVLNIADLSREDVIKNKFTITLTAETAEADAAGADGITVNATALVGDVVLTDLTVPTDANRLILIDALVADANANLKASAIAGFASHDWSGTGTLVGTKITIEGVGIVSASLTTAGVTTLTSTADGETATNPGTLDVDGAAMTADLKNNAVYTPDYVNYGPLYTMKKAGYKVTALIHPTTDIAGASTHWDSIDLTRASSDWFKDNEYNLFNVDNYSGYWAYLETEAAADAITVSNVVYSPVFTHHFNVNDSTENSIISGTFSAEISGITDATSNVKLIVGGSEIQLLKSGSTYSATLTEFETSGLTANTGSPIAIAIRAADGISEASYDAAITTLDFDKPLEPTVVFSNGTQATFASTSTDVASYSIYENFIPDDYASPVKANLLAADAAAYNVCLGDYDSSHSLKVVAVDGLGTFTTSNVSDAKSFTYKNILKSAAVVSGTFGTATSTTTDYNSTCEVQATSVNPGIDVQVLTAGTARVAFQPISTSEIDATTDLPWTVFYDLAGSGTAVVKLTVAPGYASNVLYVEFGGALYRGTFPATRAAADATFTTPSQLTPQTSVENQTLTNP